jgi:hypothetical protein
MTGPGWTTDRDYQAGDRVLLHARSGPPGGRLVNGTAAAVTRVEERGLTIVVDRSGEEALLPVSFVAGTRKDGSPTASHSWARSVDGAQGGTWETCHLRGSAAWTPTGVIPASVVPDSPPTPGTPNRSARSTTAGSWPTSATRPQWSPKRWPASPIRPWPPAATPGP